MSPVSANLSQVARASANWLTTCTLEQIQLYSDLSVGLVFEHKQAEADSENSTSHSCYLRIFGPCQVQKQDANISLPNRENRQKTASDVNLESFASVVGLIVENASVNDAGTLTIFLERHMKITAGEDTSNTDDQMASWILYRTEGPNFIPDPHERIEGGFPHPFVTYFDKSKYF